MRGEELRAAIRNTERDQSRAHVLARTNCLETDGMNLQIEGGLFSSLNDGFSLR